MVTVTCASFRWYILRKISKTALFRIYRLSNKNDKLIISTTLVVLVSKGNPLLLKEEGNFLNNDCANEELASSESNNNDRGKRYSGTIQTRSDEEA